MFVPWKAVTTAIIDIFKHVTDFEKVGIKLRNTERVVTRMVSLNGR
jgi:hypothetical protein